MIVLGVRYLTRSVDLGSMLLLRRPLDVMTAPTALAVDGSLFINSKP